MESDIRFVVVCVVVVVVGVVVDVVVVVVGAFGSGTANETNTEVIRRNVDIIGSYKRW